MISIRIEEPDDLPAVRAVNERAFGQPAEANVVDKLRQTCDGLLSLVAIDEDTVVGHIVLNPVMQMKNCHSSKTSASSSLSPVIDVESQYFILAF